MKPRVALEHWVPDDLGSGIRAHTDGRTKGASPIAAALTGDSLAERSSQAAAPDDRGAVALAFRRFDKVPPIYAVAIAICLGDGLGNFRLFVPSWLAVAIALTATVAFLTSRPRAGYLLALTAIAASATLPVRALLEPPPAQQSTRALPDGMRVTVEGVLINEPELLPDLTHLTVRVLRAGVPGPPLTAATGVVRVAVLEQVNPRIGDEMSVTARIRFPRNNGNPGEYDYEGFMAREGISATMTVTAKEIDTPAYQVLAHHSEFPFSQLQDVRDRIAALIDGSLPAVEAGEMRALVIGDRSGIDSDLGSRRATAWVCRGVVLGGAGHGTSDGVPFQPSRPGRLDRECGRRSDYGLRCDARRTNRFPVGIHLDAGGPMGARTRRVCVAPFELVGRLVRGLAAGVGTRLHTDAAGNGPRLRIDNLVADSAACTPGVIAIAGRRACVCIAMANSRRIGAGSGDFD